MTRSQDAALDTTKGFRVRRRDLLRLEEIARREHRTVSQELRRLVEQRIAEDDTDALFREQAA